MDGEEEGGEQYAGYARGDSMEKTDKSRLAGLEIVGGVREASDGEREREREKGSILRYYLLRDTSPLCKRYE